MKKLSDYQGEEAIDLWMDLLDPLAEILSDKKVAEAFRSNKSYMQKAKAILSAHKKETEEILLRIDPEPLNGLNIVLRLIDIITDIGKHDEIKSFFEFAEQEKAEKISSISVTESTEAEEN